jgi:subtilisin family serine protease
VLTVGGVNDGTNRLWYDGSCPCSGALYPENSAWSFNAFGDFNKPNVSAPAVSVRTANGMSASGTSIAAPIVSGIASQLFARNPAMFTAWPETMRAIIMAGANRRVALPTGGTSNDHEGVGTVETLWAHRVLVDSTYGGWANGTVYKGDSLTRSFSVTAGQQVRVALAWDSHTAGTMFDKTDTLTADLDLTVTFPGGANTSLTYDNSYEFVSFTAPQTGTVSIRVSQPRFDRASEYWSLAWLRW